MTTTAHARRRPTARRRRDPPTLPRRTRIGSILAGATLAVALLGSVVVGLTTMAEEESTLAGSAVSTRPM